MRRIVKLEEPCARPNRHFDVMATLTDLVRRQTPVPAFEVVAVDTTRQKGPWTYLVVTHIAGSTWMQLYPQLHTDARLSAHRHIGRAAGQLHALRFDAFGRSTPPDR